MKSFFRAEAERRGEREGKLRVASCELRVGNERHILTRNSFFPPLRALRLCAKLCLLILTACSTPAIHTGRANTVIVVPGIGGDGPVYGQILDSLREHGSQDCLQVSDWGSSYPIFFISISSPTWHEHAERDLAGKIEAIRAAHPDARIAFIAHSAGAGVVAGALSRLPPGMIVGPVIFLAPALSPKFDLRPMLAHSNIVHVFYSPADDFWQGVGPTIFGNYDRAHSSGAGQWGFKLIGLSDAEKMKVIQHPYDAKWKALGNNGGHYGWMATAFVGEVIEPLIGDQDARLRVPLDRR
jgi:pimeloyl-ACP methyl ester carboxylesterase